MRRAIVIAIAGSFLLQFQHGDAPISAQAPDGLSFFKNYFVTGDYVTGGVGLRGKGVNGIATGSISISQVPDNADIVAAYLYWQVVSKNTLGPDSGSLGVTFRDIPLQTASGPAGKVLGPAGTAPCWSSGGGTGSSNGLHKTYTYRADVLRLFDVDEQSGKFKVNGTHRVQVPDSGPSGNSVPIALGASLVIVYRDPSMPLNAIVLYDGGFTVDNSNRTMSQGIRGFYQPSASPQARITYVVGSGQANKNEKVLVNANLFLSSPFSASNGPSWDTVTQAVNLGAQAETVRSLTTSVTTQGVGGADCLTVGAIVFKTGVKDSDGDGLLDLWESATSPIIDPQGQPLPLLGSMGADPQHKDLFVEIGYTRTDVETSYGGVPKPAHSHLPTSDALKLVGDAFRDAPVSNPDGSTGIKVHFDVGAGYPSGDATDYVVASDLSRGGEAIDEMRTVCERGDGEPPWECQFSAYPGTVGWKTGLRFLRDEVVGSAPPPLPGEADVCDAPGNDGPGQPCERRFDRNRKDIFHYALFAHAAGIPKAEQPCLDAHGAPASDVSGACAVAENPDFRVPQTITGVGDFPGGDVLITLGAFPDVNGLPLGTPFMQASTLMHEIGHNLERRHGGDAFEPNCKPAYFSAMNYLYQLRGLLDDAGKPHLDFSRAAIDPSGGFLDETSIFDGSLSLLPYRLGWYAPIAGSYLEGRTQAARKHCDGTPVLDGEAPSVRIDARTAAGAIDWNANGIGTDAAYIQDVNFNGRTRRSDDTPEILRGSNDWATVHLNQVGSRRSVGGLFVDREGRLTVGPLSLDAGRGDFGRGDFGRGDFGRGDFGRGDFGRGDLGRGDFGRGDFGRGDFGRGDFGRGDFGGGDLFAGNPDAPGGELDFETATDLAKTPPIEFTACVIGSAGCAGTETHSVRLTWKSPNVGGVTSYLVYRVPGTTLSPGLPWTQVGAPVNTVVGQDDYALLDRSQLQDGQPYTYFSIAVYGDGVQSDPSNLVTIVAVNDGPALSAIANQTIQVNGTTGPLSLTIADEDPAGVTVAGTSSNQALVPNASIVVAGAGAVRTVTVTPSPNQFGTATITLTPTDGGGTTGASTSFLLTVQSNPYLFRGFISTLATAGTESAPSDSGVVARGSLQVKWQVARDLAFVKDLTSTRSLVAIPGNTLNNPLCLANGLPPLTLVSNGQPSGGTFIYDTANNRFQFTWNTSAISTSNCYRISLSLDDMSAPRVTIVRFQ